MMSIQDLYFVGSADMRGHVMQMSANGVVSLGKGSGLFLDGFDTLSTLGGGKSLPSIANRVVWYSTLAHNI